MNIKEVCFVFLALAATVAGGIESFTATDALINPNANVRRQCAYIRETRRELAKQTQLVTSPDFSDSILTSIVTTNGTKKYIYLATDKYAPIGDDGWLLFSAHSLHKEPNWSYVDVGDLSIAIDHAGQFYFSRKHVCGSLEVYAPQNGIYESIDDFFKLNPDWCRMPDNWEQTAPAYPPIDITSQIPGSWRAISLTSSSHSVYANLQFEYGHHLLCRVKADDRQDFPETLNYQIVSTNTVRFKHSIRDDSGKAGELRLIGSKLVGHMVVVYDIWDVSYKSESTVTNRLEGTWERIDNGEAPTR